MTKKRNLLILLFSICFAFSISSKNAMCLDPSIVGRPGLGISNQFVNSITAISFKIQRNKAMALGFLLGFKQSHDKGGMGLGFKLYRNLFEEPNLLFYASLMAGMIRTKTGVNESVNGFQVDTTLGSEFFIPGLHSIGFSFELGISINKPGEHLVVETLGHHFIKAAVHFYI